MCYKSRLAFMSHSVHLQKLVLDLYGELIEEVTEKTGTVQGKRYWTNNESCRWGSTLRKSDFLNDDYQRNR